MKARVKFFFTGFVVGALVIGSIAYFWMNQQLQVEKRKVEIVEHLLDTAVDQIPKPPFPPNFE